MKKWWLVFLGTLVPAISVLADTYTYDELGRLTSVTSGSFVTTYSYDAANNRTSVQTTGPVTNHAPTCTDQTTNMTGIPPMATATVTITAAMVLARCTDADGDTMTVTTPAVPLTFQISAGQTKPFTFSVSDGKGGVASVTLTYIRP